MDNGFERKILVSQHFLSTVSGFSNIPPFSAQMLSSVRILCDNLKNIVFFLVILAKIRTLLRYCAEIRVLFYNHVVQ